VCFSMIRPLRRSTLFPYTTLFRSVAPSITDASDLTVECDGNGNVTELQDWLTANGGATGTDDCSTITWSNNFTALSDECGLTGRSEEHTSELQSRENLVCRLLLEK